MANPLTGEQIRAVAAELNAWTKAAYPDEVEAGEWQIERIEHLRSLVDEAYRVTYTDGYQGLFQRDTSVGKLRPVATWSYEAQHNFEDKHKSVQQASETTCAVCGARAPDSNRCPGCRAFFCDEHYQTHLNENAQFLKSIGAEGDHA